MALKQAVSNTGAMSKNIAINDTVTNNKKATTLYSIKFERAYDTAATNNINSTLTMY